MRELQCPIIKKNQMEVGYGGNQEWFSDEFQRRAGCGSVTGSNIAAIYALEDARLDSLYQAKAKTFEVEEYLKQMETMYSYMKPGFMGYPLIGRFAKDFMHYADDCGISLNATQLFLPKEKDRSLEFIIKAIDHHDPVALLILRHPAKELREDNWHWVTITGYNEREEQLIWSNCGDRETIGWDVLFCLDKKYYVGMVKFEYK